MQKHLEEVLTAAGLPADQVAALVALPDDAKDFKPDTFVAPVRTTIETQVKNDPKFYEGLNKENLPKEFVKQLEQEQYGRAAVIVRGNMLKAVGLAEKDFEALGDEGKKIEVFTPAFVKKLSEGKVTDKELQQKLIDANTKIAELEGATPQLEEKYKTQYEKQLSEEKTQFVVLASLAQVQGLKAPANFIADKITARLRDKYAIVVTGLDAVIRQKDKPDLKVLVDGKTELTLNDAILAELKAVDLVIDPKKKTDKKDGTVVVEVEPGKGDFKLNSHVNDKISKRLAEEGKTK
jgi:hypothetical protein